MNFNFHPPYLQYMQPGHFIQPPQAVNVLSPQAVNVPQQVEEPEGKKSKRDNAIIPTAFSPLGGPMCPHKKKKR